jgi:putative MFS transporter
MELFPTSVRTTGVGLASSVSRVGSAIGTYLFPMLLASWGIGATMAVMGAVCVAGAVVSQFMAPETTGRTLSEVSSAEARGKIRFDSEVDTGPVLDAHTA